MARTQGKGIGGIMLIAGNTYQVSEGAGIDSGRVGILQDPAKFSQDFIAKNEPGRYKPFEPRKECILQDARGAYFTMFKNYLGEVGKHSFRNPWP